MTARTSPCSASRLEITRVLLAILALTGCAAEATPDAVPRLGDVTGTTWESAGSTIDNSSSADPSCPNMQQTVTFGADGFFDYSSRCPSESTARSYRGSEDSSTWRVDGDALTVSFKDGFNTCRWTPVSAGQMKAVCDNRKGEHITYTYTLTG